MCPYSTSRVEIGSEGGAWYRVTFEDVTNPGDVALLSTHPEGLTGAGATAWAREVVRGSEAVGNAVRVGFSAPQHCSTSQVSSDQEFVDLRLYFDSGSWRPIA